MKTAICLDNTNKTWTPEYFNVLLEMLIDYGVEFVQIFGYPIDEMQKKSIEVNSIHMWKYFDKVTVSYARNFHDFDKVFATSSTYIGIEITARRTVKKLLQNDLPIFANDENTFLIVLNNDNLGIKEYMQFVYTYIDNACDIVGILENILDVNFTYLVEKNEPTTN